MDFVLGCDTSHHNGDIDVGAAKADGLGFMFCKATQSANYTDPKFWINVQAAKAAGIPVGAYHFGSGDHHPIAQADHFLSVCQNAGVTVLALDFEKDTTPGENSMSVEEASQFVAYIAEKTGRYPLLYTGSWLKDFHTTDPELSKANLWLAHYNANPVLPAGFDKWTVLQASDGHIGPSSVTGVGPIPHSFDGIGPCDIDIFNGDAAALAAFWTGTPSA